MTFHICKCCGQTLPRDFLFVGTNKGLSLNGMRLTIFNAVQKAGPEGIHADRLFATAYAGIKAGGPLSGVKAMASNISHLNRQLKPHGKRIEAGRGKRFYSLVDLK